MTMPAMDTTGKMSSASTYQVASAFDGKGKRLVHASPPGIPS